MTPLLKKNVAHLLWAALAVTAALLMLFHGLLSPSEVMFANDGPFGLLKNHEHDGIGNLFGVWMSDNWVGIALPGALPTFSHLLFFLVSAVTYAKILVPLSLLFLGLSAAFFCQRASFHPAVGILVALGAALNSNPVSYACWGLAPKAITLGCTLIAMGLLKGSHRPGWRSWVEILLAGFFVGFGIMEGADLGAIMSLYVAAYAAWQVYAESANQKSIGIAIQGGLRLAVVAIAAAWIASHALFSLISTQIKGVAQPAGVEKSAEAEWAFASSFSYPPGEFVRFLVPGIYGYRMDTPQGGAYWGGFGPDGNPQNRFSGGGEYVGIVVLLAAGFGIASSFRGKSSPLKLEERRWVWFWSGVAALSLLLAWGRFAPGFLQIYRLLVSLPYFSTIRGPYKFLHGMHLALWVLSAYGFEALARRNFQAHPVRRTPTPTSLRDMFEEADPFERAAIKTTLGLMVLGIVLALVYNGYSTDLTRSIDSITAWYGDKATASFSIHEVWYAAGFLFLAGGLVLATLLGLFVGNRARAGWIALALLLVVDLLRSNTPWVKHYDYVKRHELNPLMEKLRDRPWEHRVTAFLRPQREGLLVLSQDFSYLSKEWLENHFQFFHIQSLDIDQMPRTPELEAEYFSAFNPPNFQLAYKMAALATQLKRLNPADAAQVKRLVPEGQVNLFYFTRMWQLTNTRYLLGWRDGIAMINDLFDPVARRFHVALPYRLEQKAGAPMPLNQMGPADAAQWVTAVQDPNGDYAMIEFSGALPRARLFNQWELLTNKVDALSRLISPAYDPSVSVVLSDAPGDWKPVATKPAGDVSFVSYAAKRVVLKTTTPSQQILLLNDRWHEDWHAAIDGKPVPLLRANYIMRGVAVPEGEHTVEFEYRPPSSTLWVSLSAVLAGAISLVSLGILALRR